MNTINPTADMQYHIELASALERLEQNEDFKMLILEGYIKDEAVRCVGLLANDQIKRINARPDVMEDLIAISSLQDYFIKVKNYGDAASADLLELESEGRESLPLVEGE